MSPRGAFWLLLILSAVLRFAVPGTPPGLHIDEASNAWNAKCLGQTMFDEHRAMLPVFYTRAFNDNRSPMFLYLAAPFEMALGYGGVRWPAFLGGIAATLLLWQWVRRLAGERAGLIAGLIWAIDPTFVQFTRWGHEASITPALVLGAMCLWQRAGLLWTREEMLPAKPLRWAFVAGVFGGFACYGYASVRLYLPVLLAASVLLGRGATLRPNVRRWAAAAAGFLLLFGPLLYVHLTDPAINERARQTWTWEPDDSLPTAAGKVALRYVRHFDPQFLFLRGTADPLLSTLAPPPPFGALPWVWAPLLLFGLFAATRQCRTDRLARLALVALAAYPAGDVLNALGPPNVLRSLVGWWAFALLIATGIVWVARTTHATPDAAAEVADASGRIRGLRRGGIGAPSILLGVLTLLAAAPNLAVLLLRWGTEPAQQIARGVDFERACAVIRPIVSDYDAVVFTTTDAKYTYPQVLCFLDYSPQKFLTQPIARAHVTDTRRVVPDLLANTGPLYFRHDGKDMPAFIDQAVTAGLRGKTLWVLRPTDPPRSPDDRVLQTIDLSDGTPSLVIREHRRQADGR